MDIDREMLKGHIESILLAILKEKDMYGYEISKSVKSKSLGAYEMKEGTLYLALKRLENNELLQSYWGEEEAGGGRRKYYRLLPEGQERLKQKKREWSLIKSIMDQFLEGDA